jgi:hypothetical protein
MGATVFLIHQLRRQQTPVHPWYTTNIRRYHDLITELSPE